MELLMKRGMTNRVGWEIKFGQEDSYDLKEAQEIMLFAKKLEKEMKSSPK